MAKSSAIAPDTFRAKGEGDLSGTQSGAWVSVSGDFVIRLRTGAGGAWSGTVTLERTEDGGATADPVYIYDEPVQFTTNGARPWTEPEAGVKYRLTANLSAGSVSWRVSN
ncbi:hypothetical protein JYK14_05795 [Siccirubricoccus sp. KC 17139]|uniref:Uncharacterized protein n=1 Tax=Siccirubricoccus soli TaxID=2899147 RepID=A0ABT1D339_9PROT|nr:hypothetical protein [Siccirubricoccus soli]MCO6415690.1 hypothetical protein [Siccirubricoccus soli]MCP2681822.1 hypothetical protein [Siccirubricoccus soli]